MHYNYTIGDTFAHCSLCSSDFSVSHGDRNDVTTHVKGKHHREIGKAASVTQSITSFFDHKYKRVLMKLSQDGFCC